MKLTKVKHRRFGNKKTRRIKRRGGMQALYPHLTPKQRAELIAAQRAQKRKAELAATHASLSEMVSRGVSHGVRTDFLTSGVGALAGHIVDAIVVAPQDMALKTAIKHGHLTLDGTMHRPTIILKAHDMFRQAERLCSIVRQLPDEDCWSTDAWGHVRKSEWVKNACSEARALYTDAVELKYLPAYAPLAWMMSREDPEGSIQLCDECIAKCNVIRNAASRKAKLDCTAIRAFADQESVALMMSQLHREQQHAPRWTHREDDDDVFDFESADPELEAFKTIMEESIEKESKYGHAMKWLWLSTLNDEYPNPDDIAEQKRVAENMGIDFDRCR